MNNRITPIKHSGEPLDSLKYVDTQTNTKRRTPYAACPGPVLSLPNRAWERNED